MSSRSDIDSSITKVCEDERVASAFGPSSSIKLPIKISNSPPTTSEEQDNNVRSTSATSTSEVDMNKTRLNRSSGSSLGSPDGSYQNDSSSNNNNDSHRHQYRRQSSSQYNAEETANILSRRRRAIGGEEEEDSFPLPHAVYIYAACAALNSCNLGYDIGVNTNAAIKLRDSMNLTNVQIEIFMGSLNLFAMLGALGSHFVSDRLGRRGAFMIAAVGFIIGIGIMTFAPSYGVLMFGRVFVGMGVGFGLAVDPVYIAEISPASYRGRLVTWSEIATNVGILFGFMSGLFFYNVADNIAWRGMFALGAILPSIFIIMVFRVMPESPRWLVSKKRQSEAASVLRKIYPEGYDIDSVVEGIEENIKLDTEAERAVGWDVILFPSPAFRRMLIVGVGTAIAQQAVGIDAIQYFLAFILDQSNIKSDAGQTGILILLGIIKLVFIVIAGRAFDQRGRRQLILISCAGMCMSLICLSVNFYTTSPNGPFSAFALAMYLMFFSLGMGPGCWLIPSEVFATTIRAKAMSVATFMNRVTATLMSSTFLSTANALSYGGFFLLLAIICVISGAFFYTILPETKGRSLEEMSHYFAELTGDQSVLQLEQSFASYREGRSCRSTEPISTAARGIIT